jgi:hypothetical protein
MRTFVRRTESNLEDSTTNFSILGVWEPYLDRCPCRPAGWAGGLILSSLISLVLYVFRRFRKIARSHYKLRHMSVCLSAWNYSAPTGRIIMKFYI